MIVKIMGIIDLICAGMFLLLHYNIIAAGSCALVLFFLVAKTIGFWGDIASFLDGLCALYMILMFFGLRTSLVFVVAIYLAQKGALSLLAE